MSKELDEMLSKAKATRENAYAPYSHFKVGVCLKTKNNQYFTGANFENVAYLQGCAETSAIGTMISAGEKEITEIVVVGSSAEPSTPCGACRQRLLEFCDPKTMKVHLVSDDKIVKSLTLAELLPESYKPEEVK